MVKAINWQRVACFAVLAALVLPLALHTWLAGQWGFNAGVPLFMGVITLEPILRKDIAPKIGNSITRWNTFVFRIVADGEVDVSVADGEEGETAIVKTHIEFECAGFLGAVNNAGTIPLLGDSMLAANLSAIIGTDETLPDISAYTNIKIVPPWEISYAQDPASWSIRGRSGVTRMDLPGA